MNMIKPKNNKQGFKFHLPPKGSLEPAFPFDPLPLYYHPVLGFIYRGRIKQALSLLKPQYDSVLELGYGSGILLPTLARNTSRVCGIDIDTDPDRAGCNLKKIGVNACLTKGDIHSVNYPDESFDLIIAISVFEHIVDPEPVLKEVCRLLRPDGELLIGIPRVDYLMEMLFPFTGEKNIKSRHITSYHRLLESKDSRLELVKLLKLPCLFLPLYFNLLFRKAR